MKKRINQLNLYDTLTYKLDKLHRHISRLREHSYLTRTGLPMSEGRCLASIGFMGDLSVRELAERANLHSGQVSRTAQSLVEKGLVKKVTSVEDAREVRLSLTDAGGEVWQRVSETIGHHNAEFFSSLTSEERDEFSRLLSKLIEASAKS